MTINSSKKYYGVNDKFTSDNLDNMVETEIDAFEAEDNWFIENDDVFYDDMGGYLSLDNDGY